MEADETPPPESNEHEFNEDVLKQESEPVDCENSNAKTGKLNFVTVEMIEQLSEVLKNNWEKLASKLGYAADEVY